MLKIEWNRRFTTIAVYAFLVLAGAILFFYGVNNFATAKKLVVRVINPIRPVFYGLIIAYLLNPIMNFYEKKLLPKLTGGKTIKPKFVRIFGVLLTYVTAALVVVGFLMIIIPQVVVSVYGIVSNLSEYTALAEKLVRELFESIPVGVIPPEYMNKIVNFAGDSVEAIFGAMTAMLPAVFNFTVGVTSSLFRGIMAFIISIYILAAKEKFAAQTKKLMYAFMSSPSVNRALSISRTADRMFGGFISGKIVDSLIIGLICFAGLSVMNMPNTVLVSFIVGVTNIIPFFGPFFGAIPSFLIIFIESPMQAYLFVVFIIILQQLDGNVIGPMILGDSTGLSAFWVVFAILLFGGLFGVPGMVVGVPVTGVIFWLLQEAVAARLSNKNLPTVTEAYMSPGAVEAKKQGKKD